METRRIGVLTLLLVGCVVVSAARAESPSRYDWGQHGDEELVEGDIVIESTDGTRKVAKVLGAPLGNETVEGIDVGLYVLQATNPERLKQGARGPTHLFNVSFAAEGGTRLVTEALGAVIIEGAGATQRVTFRPQHAHQQAEVRLEEEGEYRIGVEFVAEGHRGQTQTYPFVYKRKPGPFRHDHKH